MKSTDEINQAVLELWRNTDPDIRGDLMPLLLSPIVKGALVFIGFNPSFSNEGERQRYKFCEPQPHQIAVLAKNDMEGQNGYRYFNQMHKITAEVNKSLPRIQPKFGHLDLFFIRDTNQKKAEGLLLTKGDKFSEFGRQQFELFLAALKLAEPACVVVANAKSSHLLKDNLKLNEVSESASYYVSEEYNCPFHLGSMLSGQRAMDVFSVKRLTHAIITSLKERSS